MNGSSAQEECICRCTTLYPCLNTQEMWDKFYLPHRKANNPLYNDDSIYTPDVVVFKSDINFPEPLAKEDWWKVNILTCAAPNLRERPSNAMNPNAGTIAAKVTQALVQVRSTQPFATWEDCRICYPPSSSEMSEVKRSSVVLPTTMRMVLWWITSAVFMVTISSVWNTELWK